jgi:two-component system, NarL family, sensor histidine kinase UhpB
MTEGVRQLLKELENDKSLFKSILQSMGDGVSILDTDFRVVYQNPAHRAIVGDHASEYCFNGFEGRDEFCEVCPVKGAFADGVIHTVEKVIYPDGIEKFVEITASSFRASTGEIIAGIEIVRDVTRRKQMEHSLNQVQFRFNMFMEHIPGVAFIKDLDLRMVYANHSFEVANRIKPGEWLGKKNEDMLPPDIAAEYTKNDLTVLHEGRAGQFMQRTQINGELKFWSVIKFPLKSLEGKTEYLGGIGVDVTEMKNTEKVLQKTTKELWALAAHLQSVREGERTRIAREIHDELGQQLTGVLLALTNVNAICNSANLAGRESLHEQIESSISAVEGTIQAVRKIATELRPIVLDRFGLIAAIEWLVKEYRTKTGIHFSLNLPDTDLHLAAERETALFRIVQESLTNIARHSAATAVNVLLKINSNQLTMEINDNGKGLSGETKSEKQTLGFLGMKERAFFLGGSLSIVGEAGKGTSVIVQIPLISSLS